MKYQEIISIINNLWESDGMYTSTDVERKIYKIMLKIGSETPGMMKNKFYSAVYKKFNEEVNKCTG